MAEAEYSASVQHTFIFSPVHHCHRCFSAVGVLGDLGFCLGGPGIGLGSSVNLSIHGLWLRCVSGWFHLSCGKLQQAVGGGWRRT